MELEGAAVSGQGSDNAGQDNSISLDDAITAAFGPSEGKAEAGEPKAQDAKPEAVKSAGDEPAGSKPVGEDVKAADQDKQADDGAKAPAEAPKHWPENRRQTFAKMPPEVQAAWLEHDKDLQGGFTRKSQELSDTKRFAESIKGLFDETTKSQLQRAGLDEVGAISQLLRLQQMATRDPVAYAKWFIENTGITPEHLGFPQTKQPEKAKEETDPLAALLNPQPDPRVKQLEAELAALRGDVTGIMTAGERARQAQIHQQMQALNESIISFRSAIDEHGLAKYPHFDQVQKHMGVLMDADPDLVKLPDGPEKLERAYDMAVHARPDLRQSVIEQEVAKRMAEARKKEEAERARRITSVKPGVGAATAKVGPKTLDDIIKQTSAEHGL